MVEIEVLCKEGAWKKVEIDSCLVPLIKALNSGGIVTLRSCCGHGMWDGFIQTSHRLLTISKVGEDSGFRYWEEFEYKARDAQMIRNGTKWPPTM